MRRPFTLLAALAGLMAAGAPQIAKDGVLRRSIRAQAANPLWMPTRSQRVKNKIRARQKAS